MGHRQEAADSSALSRRALLRGLAASSATTLLLAACSPIAPASQPAPTPPSAAPPTPAASSTLGAAGPTSAAAGAAASAAQPRNGGTLRYGVLGDLPNIDGHWTSGRDVIWPIWDRLAAYDPQLHVQPGLAESWEVNSTFTQVRFKLRSGVQFHTGREFTSEDARWNFNRLKTDNKVDGGARVNTIALLSSLETPDKYTLVLNSEKPWPGVFDMVNGVNMQDPETLQGPSAATQAVGTGPFMFVDWVQGDHITLKKNPNYWQSGKPYLDGIQVKIYTDPQAMTAALEGGALDMIFMPPLRDTVRLQKDPKYRVVLNDLSGNRYIILAQCKDPAAPTGNQQLRQALNYAMDRQRWVDSALLGVGKPGDLPYAPNSPAYDPARDARYTFDLDKARSLVTSSGVSNPQIDFMYSTAMADYAAVAQIYQADLAKIGVTLNIKPTEAVQYADQLFNSKFPGLAGGQVFYGQLFPGYMAGVPYFSAGYNWASFKNDALGPLADAIRQEIDPAKQKQAYASWSDFVLDQSWAMVWGWNVPRVATTSAVQGVAYNMNEFVMTNNVWLSA